MQNWIPDLPIRIVWTLPDFSDREFETRVREIKQAEQAKLEQDAAFARPHTFASSDENLARELIDIIAR